MTIGYIVALFVLFTYDVPDDGSFPFDRLVIFGLFLILFFRIIWLKGEKPPKWQWGRKKEDDQARPPSEKTYT